MLSLADPTKPALLGPAVPLEEVGGLGRRSAAFVASRSEERFMSLRQVAAVEGRVVRKAYRFNCWA